MEDDLYKIDCLREAIAAVRLRSPNLTARQVHEELVAEARWEHIQLNAVKKMCGKMTKAAQGAASDISDAAAPAHEHPCENCGCTNAGRSQCSACGLAWYCSKECQKAHYKEHRPACKAEQIAARARILAADGHNFEEIAAKECSSVSIINNVRSVCGGGRTVDRDIKGVMSTWGEAVDGNVKSFECMTMLADGNQRYTSALKVLDGRAIRPWAQYLVGKLYEEDKVMQKFGRRRNTDILRRVIQHHIDRSGRTMV